MSQPEKKSGLKVEMDVVSGRVQGLADTGKFDPGKDSPSMPGNPGEGGQARYADLNPSQYHPASDVGDPGVGWRDTGAGTDKYGASPIPAFDFGKGPGQDNPARGVMNTGPTPGGATSFKNSTMDEPVSGNQSIQGGAFVASNDPNLLQPNAGSIPKGPLQLTGSLNNVSGFSPSGGASSGSSGAQQALNIPGVMNPPLSGKPGITERTDDAKKDAEKQGVAKQP